MYSYTLTYTYKLRCLSTWCIKKWTFFFFDKQFEIWQPCYLCPFVARHVPSDLAACHICTSFTKFTTLHTRLTRRMCALCIRRVCRRRHVPYVCAYDKGVDYMTASFVFIISFAHCVYQHFKHLFSVVPGLLGSPSVLSSTNYS